MTRIRRATHAGIAVVATFVTLGCSDDGGPAGNTGSIQVTVNPTTLSVAQGGNTTVTATLARGGGFNGVVTLAVTGLPTGITTSITPPQLSGTVTSATINVTAAAGIAPQAYTGTITATAPNVTQATVTYQLTVTPAPNYALSVAPAAVTIPAGTTGGATIAINRSSFDGGVVLALLDPPSGITGAFSPTPSTTNASTLVVSVAASVAPGNYPLTIQGTATGPGVKTTTLAVTVTAPPAGGTRVAYQFCDPSDVPAFFAYQDGSGAWQPVVGSTSEDVLTYAFDIRQGRGGVLVVYGAPSATIADVLGVDRSASVRHRPTRRLHTRDRIRAHRTNVASGAAALRRSVADVYQTYVSYASAAELVQAGIDNCEEAAATKTVTGTVAGVPFRQYGILSLGITTEVFSGGSSTNPVTFTDVPGGLADFVATRTRAGTPPDKAVIFRNLDIPDGGSLPATVDFDAPTALVPEVASAAITGGGTDNMEIFTELVTANGASLLWFDLAPSGTNPRPWAGIGPAALVSGDFHTVVVFATPPTSDTDFRVSLKYVGPVADQTLALGPAITAPARSLVAPGAYPRFRFQGSIPQEYDKGVSIEVLSDANAFILIATGAYLTASGSAVAYDFIMPDVAALAGFPAAARLTAGLNEVLASVFGFTGPGIFDLRPTLGSELKGATAGTTITVP